MDKKRNGSLTNNHHHHQKSSKRRLSENNSELNPSTNGQHSKSLSPKLQKPKVIQSPTHSSLDHDTDSSSSASKSVSQKITTNDASSKPIREAKKRSLIYTGNTREFLETAIAAGLIDDNGEEEDDNEYVPPGGRVTIRQQPASSSSSSENEEESERSSDDNEEEEEDDQKNSGDELVLNEEPNESEINWNVRNRPQRHTHLIRFDTMTKQDGRITIDFFLNVNSIYFRG